MDVKQRIGAVIFTTKTNGLDKFILNSLQFIQMGLLGHSPY